MTSPTSISPSKPKLQSKSRAWSGVRIFVALFVLAVLHALRRTDPVRLIHAPKTVSVGVNHTLDQVIREKCPSLYGKDAYYKPTWWLPTGNMQTIFCATDYMFGPTKYPVVYQRQYLRVPDGGILVLDVYPPFESTEDDTPIVFFLHGLTGTSQESYIRATVPELAKDRGDGRPAFRSVILNFRGCAEPAITPRLYHAGETDDIRSSLLFLTQTYPKVALYGIGFSMGASTLAVYLGQEGSTTPFKGAAGVSNPWDWSAAAHHIETSTLLNQYVYGPVLAEGLRTMFSQNAPLFINDTTFNVDVPQVLSRKSLTFNIRWYDDRVTSKLFGFRDAEDYYVQTSSTQFVGDIKVPYLAIHSADDPIVDAKKTIPFEEIQGTSEFVVVAQTFGGGHVGWWEGNWRWRTMGRWFARPVREYFQALYEVDPNPRPGPIVLPPDEDGMVRLADRPDVIGFKILGEEIALESL